MSTVSFSKRTLVISSSTPEDSFVDCIAADSKIVVNSHSEVLDCDDQSRGSYIAVDSTAVNIVADSTLADSKTVEDTGAGKTVAAYLHVTIVPLH